MLLPRFFGGEDMAKARPAEGELGSMTRSVAERVIYEANLGAEDTKIARTGREDRTGRSHRHERDLLGFLCGAEGVRNIRAEHRLLREARARVDQRSGRRGRKGEEVLSRNRERFLMQPPNVRA